MNGMLLAKRKLAGSEATRLEVVFEDNTGTAAKSVSAFQKLRTEGGVSAVIAWDDSTALALAPVTEQSGVVLVATAVDQAVIRGRTRAFLYWLTLERETQAILDEAKRRGYRRVGMVTAELPGPLLMKSELQKIGSGIDFIANYEVSPDERDFRSILTRMRPTNVDAIIAFLWTGQVGIFAKQARNLGITAPIVGSDIYEDENELKLAAGALEGAWFPQIADPLPEFRQEYEVAFPGASIYSAGNCYDAINLMANALRNGEEVSNYLSTVKNFPGALGPVSASGDHRFFFPYLIKEVRHGKFETSRDGK